MSCNHNYTNQTPRRQRTPKSAGLNGEEDPRTMRVTVAKLRVLYKFCTKIGRRPERTSKVSGIAKRGQHAKVHRL